MSVHLVHFKAGERRLRSSIQIDVDAIVRLYAVGDMRAVRAKNKSKSSIGASI